LSGILQQPNELKDVEVDDATLSLKTRGIVFKCNSVLGELSVVSW
jgi:hypothetical protein